MSENINDLQVILKVTERCNLACSYCYFFFGGDESWKKHPPRISQQTVSDIANFIDHSVRDLGIKTVNIYLHGGEPLLLQKEAFDDMCQTLRDKLKSVDLVLGLQTNATLINDKWIELFKKHNVSVGVSVDGSKETHDRYRIDHLGRGSYDRTRKGISLLMEKFDPDIGALCVIDPKSSGRDAYLHLVHELGFNHMDFLIPDNHYERYNPSDVKAVGDYLCEVFETWVKEDDEKIQLRFFASLITRLLDKTSVFISLGAARPDVAAISIASNGELSPDDVLKSTSCDIIQTNKSIYNTSLREFLKAPIFSMLHQAKVALPEECQPCMWQKICFGGEPINRYKKENGFDNPSIYCSSLKLIYEKVATYLLKSGYSLEKMTNVLAF